MVVLYFFLAHSRILHHLDVILEHTSFGEVIGAISASVVAVHTKWPLTGPPFQLNPLFLGLTLLIAHSLTPFLHFLIDLSLSTLQTWLQGRLHRGFKLQQSHMLAMSDLI